MANPSHDTPVVLTATPDDNYELKSWSGCPGTFDKPNSTCSFKITADTTVPAPQFGKVKHKLEIKPKPTKGYVTWGSYINCGSGTGRTDCTEDVPHGESVSLAATPNDGYEFDEWSGCPDNNDTTITPCTFKMEQAVTVGANFATTLVANAGGTYVATYVPPVIHTPFGTVRVPEFFHKEVTATATGGVRLAQSPWYTFQWQDASTTGASTTYLFYAPGSYSKKVDVTDRLGETDDDTATITASRPGGAGGASDQTGAPFAVPVGGVLRFVWGGAGAITAVSDDAAVAGVSVNGSEISVSGISAGIAVIVIQTSSGELRVPVQVGNGGDG